MSSDHFIVQMRPLFGEEEKRAVCEYMDEDGFITEFKRTEKFEQMISDYTGSKYCVVVNNGTVSLTLAAMALGIKAGDEVIVPNYTMIATPNSIQIFGAAPIFVDVEPETLCLDIEKVKQAVTSKTKAIILVSANGRYPKFGISVFEEFAKKHNLLLIEDAAQSIGSFYPDGRHIGRAGLVGSFSFSTPKIISTGQGGAVITDNIEIAQKIRKLKNFGRVTGGNDIHDSIGYNFKFTELQACIGIEQMKKLTSRVIRKKEIWSRYSKNLKNIEGVRLFDHNLDYTAPWFIDAIVQKREYLIAHLNSAGIGTRVMYPPINKQLAYQNPEEFINSNHVGLNGLWLPSSVQLSNAEIDKICDTIIKFYK
jgi:perosamine synthetase